MTTENNSEGDVTEAIAAASLGSGVVNASEG